MAQYNGYVSVNHATYADWRQATLGNGYNVDGMYGNQCWDFCALLWWQYGLTLYTRPGGGTAEDCWTVSRALNSVTPFTSVYNKSEILQGDVIVFAGTTQYPTGHIAFANEDYNGTNSIECLGQHQGGAGQNDPSNLATLNLVNFLGAFRNMNWTNVPPSPPTPPSGTGEKRKFPWAIAWAHWDGFKN